VQAHVAVLQPQSDRRGRFRVNAKHERDLPLLRVSCAATLIITEFAATNTASVNRASRLADRPDLREGDILVELRFAPHSGANGEHKTHTRAMIPIPFISVQWLSALSREEALHAQRH
jgi:hypothetical protein